MRLRLLPVVLAGAASLLLVRGVHAHEPVFGIGPETIYEGGVGLEVGWDFEDEGDERTAVLETELIYGLTPRLTKAGVQIPIYSSRRGSQPRPKIRAVLAVEYHF